MIENKIAWLWRRAGQQQHGLGWMVSIFTCRSPATPATMSGPKLL